MDHTLGIHAHLLNTDLEQWSQALRHLFQLESRSLRPDG
jgi:hypothetical protein